MKKFLLSLFVGLSFLGNAQFIENFSYTSTGNPVNDTLTSATLGGSIWKKHSGGSAGNPSFALVYNPTGLTYAGYAGSGVGASLNFTHAPSSSREDANAAIGSFTADSVYASFLIRISAADSTGIGTPGSSWGVGDYSIHFGSSAGTSAGSFFCRLFVRESTASANKFQFGISKASATSTAIVYGATEYDLNTTYLVVLKYKFVSGSSNDICSAFIFSSGIPTSEPAATITSTDAGSDATTLASICVRQGSNVNVNGQIDGIRVSNRWDNSPLPVKLSSFNAIGLQNQVNLNWITASEINSQNFEVERSVDGVNFTSVATVAAKGQSARSTTYQTIDRNLPASNVLYYRIKSVSISGGFEYSPVQRVSLRNINLSISPNPANSLLYINSNNLIQHAELLDMMGKRVFASQNNKTNSLSIDVSKLPNGNYALKTTIDGTSKVQKIVVSH
jgi:hypothetical protein